MEKVKVTAKQAAEIEHYKQKGEEQIDYLIDIHSLNKRPDLAIAKMKPSQLVRALHFGYEVEPEFKVGDWVVNANGTIGKITNINEFGEFEGFWEKTEMLCEKDNFVRHATPSEIAEEKERRWWAKHGRNLWELRKGDLLIDKHFGKIAEVREVEDKHYLIGAITSYESLDFIKRNYTVVCFSEQRLDREGQQ